MTTILTGAQRNKLIDLGRYHRFVDSAPYDPLIRFDPYPVVKLFTPDANATWLLVELDPEDPDLAYALCDPGLGEPELGYVRLSELESLRGLLRLPVEQDRRFEACWPISIYAERARSAGRIVT
jgi:hypothetical protein